MIRILFFADSHIGVDLPSRPRVQRRRRGVDFLTNHARALEPALAGEVDLVVHGGDVFDRPRIDRSVAHRAYWPLVRVAELGVPVFIVPGNHERSVLPHARLLAHPRIHVFDRPRTFSVDVRGRRLALAGFPYARRGVRHRFGELLDATGWREEPADVLLLCVHHCVEGATVGPGDFTFTTAPDVIRHRDVPADFSAVLSGHIHRQQVLRHDLKGAPLRVPVLYPGSVERTSGAEADEEKGYFVLRVESSHIEWETRPLPARPLITKDIDGRALRGRTLGDVVAKMVGAAPADAVLRIRVRNLPEDARLPSADAIRSFAPSSMNVELRVADAYRHRSSRTRHTQPPQQQQQLDLLAG